MSNSPAAAGHTEPTAIAAARAIRPAPSTTEPARTTEAGPNRCTSAPVNGSATHAPPDRHSSNSPSWAGESASASRTAGVRAVQEAKQKPFIANASTTAVRAQARFTEAHPPPRSPHLLAHPRPD